MYEEHYHLSNKPFQLSPDPRFFFASNKHQQALSYLQYGLEQGEGFIVITGPIGCGKTTIAKNLVQTIDGTNIQAIEIVTSNLSPNDLLGVILQKLGLSAKDSSKAEILKAIEQHLIYQFNNDKRVLLLVDEAQNLPIESVEELRMLSNFQLYGKPLIQSFLLGQEELKDIIQSPKMEQFRQRIIASCHLKPFTEQETKQYINHRLLLAGSEQQEMFSSDCFAVITKITGGIPRKINQLMDRVLLYGYLNDLLQFSQSDIESVIAEMSDEMSASLTQSEPGIETQTETLTETNLDSSQSYSGVEDGFVQVARNLADVAEFLQENIDAKVKLNRYLDKLIKQKNIAISKHDLGEMD